MGSLIAYSGISAKIRAMERWRISEEQFKQMAALETVPEAVQYLRGFPPYREILEGVEDKDLHRGTIEQYLNLSQYRDFAKLYKFAGRKQRNFLNLYFMHYEIGILKTCLRNAAGHKEQQHDLSMFREFFSRHSKIDLLSLSQCRDMEQFVLNLKGSPYFEPLEALRQKGGLSLPACENALDMLYFRNMWKIKDKCLSKDESRIIEQCFGTKMDMLNLQWICRSKKYYRLPPAEIYAMLIPIRLHLSKEEIRSMAEAETVEQVYSLIKTTWYGRLDTVDPGEGDNPNGLAFHIIDRIYQVTSRKEPYSIAVLNSCLYFKEREIERIITTIERIRYGVAVK